MIIFVARSLSSQIESISGIEAVGLPSFDSLDLPVSNHADMLLCVIENTVFAYKEYMEENRRIFDKIVANGYKAVSVLKKCGSKYPNDIGLNVLIIGKKAFCNEKNIAEEILDLLHGKDYDVINVKQGYACCSTLVLNSTHAITADKGLAKSLTDNGIETLEISADGIYLDGYNCGFIGGASGVIGKKIYINGDLKSHPSYNEIVDFVKELDIEIISISSGRVYDFGGFKVI